MKTMNNKQKIFPLLTITIIVLLVGSISSHAYAASVKPLEHQGKPIQSLQITKQPHNFEFIKLLKTDFKDLKTFVHMDDFSLAHRSSHV